MHIAQKNGLKLCILTNIQNIKSRTENFSVRQKLNYLGYRYTGSHKKNTKRACVRLGYCGKDNVNSFSRIIFEISRHTLYYCIVGGGLEASVCAVLRSEGVGQVFAVCGIKNTRICR